MKTITLGKIEGKQSFAFEPWQTEVSGKHATITIDDNGGWWLEDRWSMNGTYIRENDGSFRRIGNRERPGKCQITPLTFIKLGIDDNSGCLFYAKQADQNENYNEEFHFIRKKHEDLCEIETNKIKKIKRISLFIDHLLPFVLMVLMCFIITPFCKELGGFAATFVSSGGTFLLIRLSGMMKLFYRAKEKEREIEKNIKEQRKQFSYCPNPKCKHILSDSEVELMKCGTCNIKYN